MSCVVLGNLRNLFKFVFLLEKKVGGINSICFIGDLRELNKKLYVRFL